jgi:hypothetical protein
MSSILWRSEHKGSTRVNRRHRAGCNEFNRKHLISSDFNRVQKIDLSALGAEGRGSNPSAPTSKLLLNPTHLTIRLAMANCSVLG